MAHPPTLPASSLPWWRDPRFQLPAIFVGASVVAVGAWALWQRTVAPARTPVRDELGLAFPAAGYVLCPQGLGLDPTFKTIGAGDFVVLWLATDQGEFVEATWARVARVDPDDPNRLLVVLGSEDLPALASLRTSEHGFVLGTALWVTADCIPDALRAFPGGGAAALCGPTLTSAIAGLRAPAAPPALPSEMVGREIEILLGSTVSGAYAWRAPARARVVEVSPTGQIATVQLLDIKIPGALAYGPSVAGVRPGTLFDITWDCVVSYSDIQEVA